MTTPAFNETEIISDEGTSPRFEYPLTGKEAVHRVYEGSAPWQILTGFGPEYGGFNPSVLPDNIARAIATPTSDDTGDEPVGGKDMFGIEWVYVPEALGSMVKPGNPLIADASELESKLVWPDINSWDWQGSRAAYEQFFAKNRNKAISTTIVNGWFERLISFMDFEGALVAMIDEEQQPFVKELYNKLSLLYIEIIKKMEQWFPEIDIYNFHDDWGSQQNSFFSPELIEEMIVPSMRLVTDYIHSLGKYADLHSCGKIENMTSNIIAAGWDSWNPQAINDTHELYRRYGDRLIIGVMPRQFDPDTASEEEQRSYAQAYAEQFCSPERPSFINTYAELSFDTPSLITPLFNEELYRQSRIKYSA